MSFKRKTLFPLLFSLKNLRFPAYVHNVKNLDVRYQGYQKKDKEQAYQKNCKAVGLQRKDIKCVQNEKQQQKGYQEKVKEIWYSASLFWHLLILEVMIFKVFDFKENRFGIS